MCLFNSSTNGNTATPKVQRFHTFEFQQAQEQADLKTVGQFRNFFNLYFLIDHFVWNNYTFQIDDNLFSLLWSVNRGFRGIGTGDSEGLEFEDWLFLTQSKEFSGHSKTSHYF